MLTPGTKYLSSIARSHLHMYIPNYSPELIPPEPSTTSHEDTYVHTYVSSSQTMYVHRHEHPRPYHAPRVEITFAHGSPYVCMYARTYVHIYPDNPCPYVRAWKATCTYTHVYSMYTCIPCSTTPVYQLNSGCHYAWRFRRETSRRTARDDETVALPCVCR